MHIKWFNLACRSYPHYINKQTHLSNYYWIHCILMECWVYARYIRYIKITYTHQQKSPASRSSFVSQGGSTTSTPRRHQALIKSIYLIRVKDFEMWILILICPYSKLCMQALLTLGPRPYSGLLIRSCNGFGQKTQRYSSTSSKCTIQPTCAPQNNFQIT